MCKTYAVLSNIHRMQIDTKVELNHTLSYIQDNVPHIKMPKRVRKALLPFIGGLSKSLFGTATMEDVNILKQHINALTKNARQVSKFIKSQNQHLSSYMSTANERLDNIQQSVTDNFYAITNLSHIVTHQVQQVESNLLELTYRYYEQLEHSQRLINEFKSLKQDITSLLDGMIPPR